MVASTFGIQTVSSRIGIYSASYFSEHLSFTQFTYQDEMENDLESLGDFNNRIMLALLRRFCKYLPLLWRILASIGKNLIKHEKHFAREVSTNKQRTVHQWVEKIKKQNEEALRLFKKIDR